MGEWGSDFDPGGLVFYGICRRRKDKEENVGKRERNKFFSFFLSVFFHLEISKFVNLTKLSNLSLLRDASITFSRWQKARELNPVVVVSGSGETEAEFILHLHLKLGLKLFVCMILVIPDVPRRQGGRCSELMLQPLVLLTFLFNAVKNYIITKSN